jgi:hypothetical protein
MKVGPSRAAVRFWPQTGSGKASASRSYLGSGTGSRKETIKAQRIAAVRCSTPATQQNPGRLPAQRAPRNRSRANAVQAYFASPVQLSLLINIYLTPVSGRFRRKAFWFRGLWRNRGQRFAVCGRNPAHLTSQRGASGRVPHNAAMQTTTAAVESRLGRQRGAELPALGRG